MAALISNNSAHPPAKPKVAGAFSENHDVDSIVVTGRFEFHTYFPPPPPFTGVPKVFPSNKNIDKVSGPQALGSARQHNRCILVPASPGAEQATLAHGPAPSAKTPKRAIVASGSKTKSNPPPLMRSGSSNNTRGSDLNSRLEAAKVELQAAVDAMEFERAAKLRDKVKQLEAEQSNGGDAGESSVFWDSGMKTTRHIFIICLSVNGNILIVSNSSLFLILI